MPPVADDLDALTRPSRVLVIDFERYPGLPYAFENKCRRPHTKWKRHPGTLCLAYQWHGSKRIGFHSLWDDGPDAFVQAHWDLYDQADIVVTYYGTGADNKWAQEDWDITDRPDPRPWKDVDLYRANVARHAFPSNSLDHLTKRLNVVSKSGHYDPAEADAAYEGDPAAQRRLRRYNIGDVRATTALFDRMRTKLGPRMPHAGLFNGSERCCWNCGGEDFEPVGDVVAVTNTYPAYRCKGCGVLSRSTHRRRAMRLRAVR